MSRYNGWRVRLSRDCARLRALALEFKRSRRTDIAAIFAPTTSGAITTAFSQIARQITHLRAAP
ncbi:MAG: hypothetical protein HY243_16215 [Proteobacteria bacterium]|nr:hypothetical protein [Pseudomonadota bacterium]